MDEVKISIKGHEYTVAFPNVGQYYRIEAMKQSLSRGFYNSMVMSPANSAQHALDMIDIEATLVVLCPQLVEDLKVKNFDDLDVRDYKLIRCHKFLETVHFIYDKDHRLFRTAEHICDTCICIYESLPYIRHKNDHICGIDRNLCLFTHL